jgi:hypothetical protein
MRTRHAYKNKAKSALRTKRAAAGMLAAAVLLAQAMPAFAVDYYTANGTVYVEQTDSDEKPVSWQGKSQRPEGDTGVSNDSEINIYGVSNAQEASQKPTTAQIVQVGDNVQGADIYITDVNTAGTTDTAIEIGKNADVDLHITNTQIENAQGDGISIGADSNVDITFEGDNAYSAAKDAENTAGIRVKESTAPAQTTPTQPDETETNETEPDESKPDETEQGETQPDEGESGETEPDEGESGETQPDESKPDETEQGETQSDETKPDATELDQSQIDEINDTAQESGADETEEEEGPKVTITGKANAKGAASFTVTNADNGIYIGKNSEVVITGGVSQTESETGEASEAGEETEKSAEPQATESNLTLKIENSKIGAEKVGVENHGALTVTGGADVEITNKSKALYATDGSTTTLEGDATVTIKSGETALQNNATLTVEDATLTARKISLQNGAGMAIEENAKVEANQIVNRSATSITTKTSLLVITGGTLKLTGSKSAETLDSVLQTGLNADHMETLYTDVQNSSKEYVIWPTNGSTHGGEKLVNFQLTADETHRLFDVVDLMGETYTYSVDLDKYDAGETLSVWVPVVLLDYYYRDDLPEGTSFEGMTEDEVLALLKETQYRDGAQDAVIRGQSIRFATLKGYTTGNADEEGKTWYYYYEAPTDEIEDGAVDDDAQVQTGQWLVFSADTPVTAKSRQALYAFSSEHFGETSDDETNDTSKTETEKRDDSSDDDWDDDLDDISSSTEGQTLGTFNIFGAFGNRGNTTGTASYGEIGTQPNQSGSESGDDSEQAAEQLSPADGADGQGSVHDTEAYATAGTKTGDETPLWGLCALLATCGLAVLTWRGKKRGAPCKH